MNFQDQPTRPTSSRRVDADTALVLGGTLAGLCVWVAGLTALVF